MEIKEAMEILQRHNEWRRDNEIPSSLVMISPKELGIAFDVIGRHYEENEFKPKKNTK